IVPIAVLVKWFPDRRGLITGIAVGGFGAGALITAPVATRLIATVGVLETFAYLGIAFLIVTLGCGFFMQDPPQGWKPAGWTPTVSEALHRSTRDYSLGEALKTWQWWAVWLLTVVAFLVLLCYGGGFGTMPAFAADYFGSKNVGPIYGLMLTAWGFASAFGPLLIAYIRQVEGNYRGALHAIAGIAAASMV